MNEHWRKLLGLFLALGLVASACGDDGDDTSTEADDDTTTTESSETDETTDTTEDTDETTDTTEGDGEAAAPDLAAVCPASIVIQTDWFPEAEHGALYELIGDDYTIDADAKRVSGNMVLGGEELGVTFEIRAGGPAIGTGSVGAEMYVDDEITLGYATTDGQVLRYEETPLLSVVAPLETNPQIIYWDPETYPEIETLADLGEAGVTINVFPGGTFADVFVAQGIWNEDQIDPSYDGSPGRFVAEGNIAQQGFASAEPWLYQNQIEDFGRELAYETLNDAGFQVYSQTVAIRPDDLETLRPCLEELVPVIQQATVDYYADPAATNALIVETVEAYDTFWTYPAELAEFSAQIQIDEGFAGNGDDSTVGNMDEARVQTVLDAMTAAEMDVPADLTVADLITNEFIDDSIGF
ncbi:MAG: ABC transporter substrate-binding protein [Acidimicrobiales bacterium]